MANLPSSVSCVTPSWSNSQSKSNSHGGQASKKNAGGGGGSSGGGGNANSKKQSKRPPKKSRKSSSVDSPDMFDDDQDHLEACFRDSDYGKGLLD